MINSFVSDIHSCNILDLGKIANPSGNMTIYQNGDRQPFEVKRVYYLYDVPSGSEGEDMLTGTYFR